MPPRRSNRWVVWLVAAVGALAVLGVIGAILLVTFLGKAAIVDEDFAGGAGQFPISTSGPMSTTAEDGVYKITVNQADTFVMAFLDFHTAETTIAVEADLTTVDAPSNSGKGVVCLHDHTDGYQGYAFVISDDGNYLLQQVNGNDRGDISLDQGTFTPNSRTTQQVRLECSTTSGVTTLVGKVDGKEVARATNAGGFPDFPHAGVGVYSSKTPARFDVDNVKIVRL